MLGHRGCRLGVTYPEITEMQARAIFEAAAEMFDRQDTERMALVERHLRERGITTEQALVEMWAAENRERTVTRRYQRLALVKIAAERAEEGIE